MPLGKIGRGIESYSALHNPKITPISNFYCRGYMDINDEMKGNRFRKNNTALMNTQNGIKGDDGSNFSKNITSTLHIKSGILSVAPGGQEDMLNYVDESIRSSPNVFERQDIPELIYSNAYNEEAGTSSKEYKLIASRSSFVQTKTESLKVQRQEMNRHK